MGKPLLDVPQLADALALEYQGDYGTARGDLDISDVVNNPFVNCVVSISGAHRRVPGEVRAAWADAGPGRRAFGLKRRRRRR